MAEEGLAAAPESGRLHLIRAAALERGGEIQPARQSLRRATPLLAGAVPDEVALLRRWAELEDAHGTSAPVSYAALATALERSAPQSADLRRALERGLEVSVRDSDWEKAAWFHARLRLPTPPGARDAESPVAGLRIPGGLHALSFIARGKPRPSAEHFLAEYSRAIIQNTSSANRQATADYTARLRAYFQRIAELESFGARRGDRLAITLSVADRDSRQITEKVSHLLGWKARNTGNHLILEVSEKTVQSRRKETASALEIDEVRLQENLQAGRPFTFEIPNERADLMLEESAWRAHFYPKQNPAGGFAQALAENPQMARLYVGLSGLHSRARAALLSAVGLKDLGLKYAGLLCRHGTALAVENGRAATPGGEPAEPVWASLVGADPKTPARFFQVLLEKDQGLLLAYFSALSRLDGPHQRYTVRSEGRARKLYELFRLGPEWRVGAGQLVKESPLIEFLRSVPLDEQGRARLPGGPGAWTSPGERTAPEEEILARLARPHHDRDHTRMPELAALVAVQRIDAHRAEPLTEAAARLLAGHYWEFAAAYPYFAVLDGLGEREFASFFALGEKLRRAPPDRLPLVMGQLHSLIALLCRARESGAMNARQAAALFAEVTERFAQSASAADFTASSLDMLRRILAAAAERARGAGADESVGSLLLGHLPAVAFGLNGAAWQLDPGQRRLSDYREVLELQKVPALEPLLSIYDAAARLGRGDGEIGELIRILEQGLARIPAAEIPGSLEIRGRLRARLESYQPNKLRETVERLRQGPPAGEHIQKLSREILAELNSQVTLALAGLLYASHLSPNDLLVAEDPLFLRKHEFIRVSPVPRLFVAADLAAGKAGSHLTGGFADFGAAAGRVALAGAKQTDSHSEAFFTAQISSLRITDWSRLRDEDLTLAGLKMRLAREWLVRAAADSQLHAGLAEATRGLLAPARRAELFDALESRNWKAAWDALTLPDLYFLADRYLQSYSTDLWESPVTRALRRAYRAGDGARLQALGASLPSLLRCGHPHLAAPAPYEEYESYLMTGMIGERSAEFKLYLAHYFAGQGIPAAALSALAEPAAEEILRELPMSDLRDWRSAQAAFHGLNHELVERILRRER